MEGTRLGAKRPLFAEYIPAIEMQQVPCMTCIVCAIVGVRQQSDAERKSLIGRRPFVTAVLELNLWSLVLQFLRANGTVLQFSFAQECHA